MINEGVHEKLRQYQLDSENWVIIAKSSVIVFVWNTPNLSVPHMFSL